mmetsp:Transcript_116686/g.232635  ORF Transcript_116686/g.232635 Transcript_116686/m.232635 type:complete len:1034 (-) Transcript_116686:63-3164(-)
MQQWNETMQQIWGLLVGAQSEIVIFLAAIFVHAVLFGRYKVRTSQKGQGGAGTKQGKCLLAKADEAPTPSQAAEMAMPLVRIVKQLMQKGADSKEFAVELVCQLQTKSDEEATSMLVGMLEIMGKAVTSKVLVAVRSVMIDCNLKLTPRLGELLLRNYAGIQLYQEARDFVTCVEREGVLTPISAVLALRATLGTGDFDASLVQVKKLAALLRASISGDAPAAAPKSIMQQLIAVAAQKSALPRLLQELYNCRLCTSWSLETVLAECVKVHDGPTLNALEAFATAHGLEFTGLAYAHLIRGADSAADAQRHFEAACKDGVVVEELLLAAVDTAIFRGDAVLAQTILQHLNTLGKSAQVAVAVIRLAVAGPLRGDNIEGTILDLYDKHLAGANILMDQQMGQFLVNSALHHGRMDIVTRLMAVAEDSQQHALLKSLGSQNRLGHARDVFNVCPEPTSSLYNSLLEACNASQDVRAAECVMQEATSSGLADVVTYNTMVKAYLQCGDLVRLRATVEAMRSQGGDLAPNCVTFNELIGATIRTNSEGVWALMNEMRSCGVSPNQVTCSILLKNIQPHSRSSDVEKTLAIINALEDIDEALLSSACEACIRVGRFDLLSQQLERQRGPDRVHIRSSHTYGTIIRAYGVLQDRNRVWDTWHEMRTRHMTPTSIAIGCMTEALASNGDPESAHELLKEMLAESDTRPLVNSVIYCSVLKGFSHNKCFDRVWCVYKEMKAAKLTVSLAAYNTLIDACTRSGEMAQVPQLLESMASDGLEPNTVTYSTIIKGYCLENRLDKAMELLHDMKQSSRYRPDEITYNTLIDGCARYGHYDRGMAVLAEMQEMGVRPSNFTLSVLAKLATRSRRPERAFELCEDLSKRYGIRLNVQVYNNLVHACTANQDLQRGLKLLEQMQREGVRPDGRTFTLLLRGSLASGEVTDTAALLRAAFGLPGGHPAVGKPRNGSNARSGWNNIKLCPDVVAEVLEGLVAQRRDPHLAVQLLRDLRTVPGLRIDPRLHLRLTASTASTAAGSEPLKAW